MASSSTFKTDGIFSNDWQYQDNIENATWERLADPEAVRVTGLKARWGDFDTPDLQSLAAGLGLSSEAAAVVVWQPDSNKAFAPAAGHILRRESLGNEGWVIIDSIKSRFGHWSCACEREVTNG